MYVGVQAPILSRNCVPPMVVALALVLALQSVMRTNPVACCAGVDGGGGGGAEIHVCAELDPRVMAGVAAGVGTV